MTEQDRRIVILGGGGHAKVVLDVLRSTDLVPCAICDPARAGSTLHGVPVVGGDDAVPALRADGVRFAFVAIGNNAVRRRLSLDLLSRGFDLPTLIAPSAVIAPTAQIADGVLVMPNAVINADARIGRFAIVNTGAIVEHDCVVGDGAHIAPRAVLGGSVSVDDEAFVGIGSVVRPGQRVGRGTTVGAGAVVVSDIPDNTVVIGCPAKEMGS